MRVREKTCHRLLGVLLAVSLSLAGCGSPGETSGGISGMEEVSVESPVRPQPQTIDWSSCQIAEPQRAANKTSWYLTEYYDDYLSPGLGHEQPGYSTISACTAEGMFYNNWLYRSDDGKQESFCDRSVLDSFDVRTGQSLHTELALADSTLPRDASLYSMDMADSRQAVFLAYTPGEPGEPTLYSSLLFYDLEEGVQKTLDLLPILASLGLENELDESAYLSRRNAALCDREGRCYLIRNRSLLVIDQNGELLCHMEGDGIEPALCLCRTPEGLPLFVFQNEESRVSDYYIYDRQAGELRSLGQTKYLNMVSGCMDVSGNIYYFNQSGSIVRWNILSGEQEKIFDCKGNRICENTYSSKGMLIRENGDLALMNPTVDTIYVFSPDPPAETRTLTLVSAVRGDSIIPTAATLFSTKRPGAKIDISSFTSSGSDDLDTYTANLVNRIVAGDAPDMFVVSAETMYNLYEKGALADLTDIFPESERENVFDCIWKAGTIDGKLVGLTTDQVTYSILVPDEVYPQDRWQLKDVLELADRAAASGDTFKGILPLTQYDASPLSWLALYAIESSLVDRENGTCHFDSEDFRKLMEYCKNTLPIEDNPYVAAKLSEDAGSVMSGEYLAYAYANYFGFSNFSLMMSSFPEDCHWVGVPTDGESGNLLYARDFLVVSKDAEDMDLIREFLLTVYGEDLMRLYPERCLRRDVLRNCVHDAYPGDPTPYAEYSMGNGVIRCLECKPDGTSYAEDYIEFMDSCILMPPRDDIIADIIREEAEPYFAGDKDLDQVIDNIQKRVQLYLYENS